MIKRLIGYITCLYTALIPAQTAPAFVWPLDTPHVLTGNYGELRPNHFHVGLDFSTGGKINYPVYAVADGYVSRVKVSSGGYGKAVYITHRNGRLSLYAHFNAYAGPLAEAVKREQYARQSYEVEFFPDKSDIKVKQGELIGYSGNTGSSSGPHLHFEIRDEKTEVPLNALEIYRIDDKVKPMITQLAIYNLADTSLPVFVKSLPVEHNRRDSLFLRKDSMLVFQPALGLAFAGYDCFKPKGNPNVPYAARLWLDGKLIYSHRLRAISFADQRFVNEFAETVNKVKYQKCFLPTLYPQGVYETGVSKGRIVLQDTNYHQLKLMLSDEHGNTNSLELYIKTRKPGLPAVTPAKGDLFVNCSKETLAVMNGLRLFIPKGALYYSTPLLIRNNLEKAGTFQLLPSDANLAATIGVGFKIPKRFTTHPGQLVLRNHAAVYVPAIRGDSVFYSVYNFGSFELEVDTVPPRIKTQLSPSQIKRLKKKSSFSFIVSDQLSGVLRCNLFINGQWVLGEYDAKNRLLTYTFDAATPVGDLPFTVEAEDRVGNKETFEYLLKR